MVAALASGVTGILPFADLEACRAMQSEGYLIGGERNGLTAPGFEMGNSPVAYLSGAYQGRKLAMTTTNGTQAIEKSKGAAQILIGAFPNLQATVTYIQAQQLDVLVHCAGWKGRFNLEDSLYAGSLVKSLESTHKADEDGALAMKSLFEREGHNLKGYLSQASHAKRLQNHGIESDIDFCLTLDLYQEVVKVDERGFLVRV
jgi:2-phosphosulfolactate phosphatase